MNVENNERLHRFEVVRAGDVAYLSYRIEDDVIVLVHTEVPHSLSGHGIAGALAQAAFDFARSRHLQVGVICPFVAKWLERHPEQRDIVRFH
jgi:predicted GNAT family acetyltransferase